MAEIICSKFIGWLGLKVRTNKQMINGIKIAFPELNDAEVEKLAKQNWKHIGINLAHALQMDNKKLVDRAEIIGFEHLETAYAKGKGVIVLSAHIGVWDTICINIKHKLAPTDTVYRPIENPFLNSFVKRFRLRVYNKLITKGNTAGRQIIKSLRAGKIVPMMSDQKLWNGPTGRILW